MRRIRTHHKHPDGKVFSRMVFIYGLGFGLMLPIFPSFVKGFFHTDSAVSLFYAVMALLMFAAAIFSTTLFSKVERTKITKASLLISAIIYFGFIIVTEISQLAVLQAAKVWLHLFILMSLALFVRDFTKAKDLGEQEGKYYKSHALGFFVGPLIGGFIASSFGYELVFVLASTVLFAGLIYFYHLHIIQKHPAIINQPKRSTHKIYGNIRKFFKSPGRAKALLISVAFMSWTRFARIYIPLYIVFAGYIESLTGIILALSILPLIFMEVKVGEFADKHGVRKPIALGFAIIATLSLAVFVNPNDFVNFFLLAAINIGGAMIEPLQEYYLFKHMSKEEEDDLYGVYMTADPIAYFLVPAVAAGILFFFPFKTIFLVFGIAMAITSLTFWSKLKQS